MGGEHGHGHAHGHGHTDGHAHGHSHGHSHAPADFGRAFAIGITLNTAFVVLEAVAGFLSSSMALVADAGHNLSDVLSLVLAWTAATLAKRPASARFTYGYRSSTILAALANAVLLLVAVGVILVETAERFRDPQPVDAGLVMIVAGVGILVNTGTALLFMRGRKDDLNIRGAFLHMAADALVSLGVVVAAALIWWTGLLWIDPLTSLLIVGVIAWGTWGLLRDSVAMGLMAVPQGIDEAAVRRYLGGLPDVGEVHDLHIWPMSTTETALTAHLVMAAEPSGNGFLRDVAAELREHHGISHTTLQIERGEGCPGRC